MVTPEKIERINFLAKKAKTIGLTEEEKEEQKILREEYLQNFRSNFKNQLETIKFVDEDGVPVERTPIKS